MMSIEVEGTLELLRALVTISGIYIGRAAPEVRPGIHVVHVTVSRDAAVGEIRALGVTVRVLKTDEDIRAEAERDHALTQGADAIRRARETEERQKKGN
jgi:hypothetical protein